jgi:hypothetical protein
MIGRMYHHSMIWVFIADFNQWQCNLSMQRLITENRLTVVFFELKELNRRQRVELKCNASGFDVILPTPERILVSQHRPAGEGLI